jgi:hypothetical protein
MRQREFNKAKKEYEEAQRRLDEADEREGVRYVREHLTIEIDGGDIVFYDKRPVSALSYNREVARVSKLAAPTLARFFERVKIGEKS